MRQFNIAVLFAFAVLIAIIAAVLLGPERRAKPEIPKTNCLTPGLPADHFERFTKCADWRKG